MLGYRQTRAFVGKSWMQQKQAHDLNETSIQYEDLYSQMRPVRPL